MKIVFAGSPEYSVPALKALNERFWVCAVITQPDRPVGRKKIITPCPVKAAARDLGLPVYDFDKISAHADKVRSLGADIMITCAYGQILSKEILSAFPKGVWNLHASLLPKFRGASPIQSAILSGDTHTGVTVMKTEEKLDSGDILLVKRVEIGERTCGELKEVLSAFSAEAATDAVELIEKGETQLLMQDEARVTFCKKINKDMARIDFKKPVEEIVRLIKAMSPEPAAYCLFGGAILNVFNARKADFCGEAGEVIFADKRGVCVACGGGAVIFDELQLAGGKRMRGADFANGRKIKAGDKLD